jgi:SAM-dependent methyltransferase
MRLQQQIWLEEHTNKHTLPSLAKIDPGSVVVRFTDYLKEHSIPLAGKAVDIGAGKGRNSAYLAKLGFETYALEYVQLAVDTAKRLAERNGVADKIHFKLTEIDQEWGFEDNYFDIAIDSFASIAIETLEGRETCRDEIYRTLKPGGYALVAVCSAEDEWEKELITNHPGPEPNSTVWPQNNMFQKDYDEQELQDFYDKFEIVELQKIRKPVFRLGRGGMATNLWLLLRKEQ